MLGMMNPERVDWIVFAEDWGGHPSTTQHLIAHLPADDRVLWVDSIGMRAPRFELADVSRVAGRLARIAGRRAANEVRGEVRVGRAPDRVLHPVVLPWHLDAACAAINGRLLGGAVARAVSALGLSRPVLATANSVLVRYLDRLPSAAVVYLRLDDFASLPGVDPHWVYATEPPLMARADLVIVPNPRLVPEGISAERVHLLPQGVDVATFSAVPVDPPPAAPQVLGYWGAIGEWLDFALIEAVARARPELTLELRGSPRAEPSVHEALQRLSQLPNVKLLPPVPHRELAASAAHWSAAWAPFSRGLHLEHASPLKLREYIAAGFAVASTPIPEANELQGLTPITGLDSVLAWLDGEVRNDSRAARSARRARMEGQGWAARARDLRAWVTEVRR